MSLTGAILMNVNLMVGASAFIGPGMMAQYADKASFYGWIFAALIFFPVVWCIAQITKHFPGKGSFYSYPTHTISRTAGFLSGWVYFLGYVSIGAMQLFSLNEILARNFDFSLFKNHSLGFSVMLLAALLCLAMLSIHIIDRIQSSATVFKVTPLLIGVISLLFYFDPSTTPFITQTSPLILIPTIPMAVFGFWGFEGVCSISHLVQDSKKNAGRAIMFGFIVAVSVYCLFHLSVLSIMGPKALAAYGAANFVNYMGISSPFILKLLNVTVLSAIIVAHINAIFGGLVANSAMFCAMAEEKLLFMSGPLSRRMKKTHRPIGTALAHVFGIIFCTVALGNKEILTAMSNLGVLIAFFMAVMALFVVQKKRGERIGQMVSLLGFGSCAALSYYSWQAIGVNTMARIVAASPLIIIMILGYVMFQHTQRSQRTQ